MRANLHFAVTPAAERAVRRGHPWVFADRIKSQNREGEAGELAILYDRSDRFLAIGLYDPGSAIRVRILHSGSPATIDDAWFRACIAAAIAKRGGLRDGEGITGYRCVNGESDGLPGLVIDRYGDVAVAKLYTAAWFPFVAGGRLTDWVLRECGVAGLVLRLSRNIQRPGAERGLEDGQVLAGTVPERVPFLEHGLTFEAEPLHGQKTGFFLDQRHNRKLVGELAAGADVLNVFSHVGGFSVHAAAGGARSATDLDISEHAVAGARRNMLLNSNLRKVAECRHETVQADAFAWLAERGRNAGPRDGTYDIVVIDPPSLAKRKSERERALAAYGQLAGLGLRCLRNSGVLVAASCSAHVTADDFFALVRHAAHRHARPGRELAATRHAIDHPAAIPEAHYLKCLFWRLH